MFFVIKRKKLFGNLFCAAYAYQVYTMCVKRLQVLLNGFMSFLYKAFLALCVSEIYDALSSYHILLLSRLKNS